MRYIELYESYSKRRMLPVDETSKIKKDLDDMFIELTDNGFRYELKSGVVGPSKLKDHNTETLYLVIAKPKNTPFSDADLFNTIYFDDTLELFKQDEVTEYVLMFIDYMKGLWGEDIEVDLPNTYLIDKYFVRIKKRL
jgi:hypothetical protein